MTARATYLVLSALKWRGLRFLDRVVPAVAELDVLVNGDEAALARIEDLQPEGRRKLLEARAGFDLAAHLARVEELGLTATTPADAAYPALLAHIADRPLALYHRGPLPHAGQTAVAMVGTRAATAYGLAVARRMARDLARAGVVVVSGLAQGIDGAAHAGALEVEGARTVAVLAGPAHRCYPPGHRDLYSRLLERGTVMSEVPPDYPLQRWMFPLRNRIISGLASSVVVIEAPLGSGALKTAKYAGEQGREVCAVPGPVTSVASAGAHQLLRDGARLVSGAADVLASAGVAYAPVAEAVELEPTGQAAKILRVLGGDAVETDRLLALTGLHPGALHRLLLDLVAAGVVSRLAGDRWVRRSRMCENVAPASGAIREDRDASGMCP